MPLLNARHRNPETAALSVAENRASKCQSLRHSWHAEEQGLTAIADRSAERLAGDVADWLKSTAAGRRASAQTREELANIVGRARGQ